VTGKKLLDLKDGYSYEHCPTTMNNACDLGCDYFSGARLARLTEGNSFKGWFDLTRQSR
jgi:hypothetical protein